MTLEEAKKILKLKPKIIGDLDIELLNILFELPDKSIYELTNCAIDTILKALEDSIPKEKVREKIKEKENKKDNSEMNLTSALFERDINLLEELLGERYYDK